MRRGFVNRRRDGNHAEIMNALTDAGAQVYDAAKHGTPFDLILFWRGVTTLVEIKNPMALRGVTQARKLTADEVAIHGMARARGCTIEVVENVAQALRLIGAQVSA